MMNAAFEGTLRGEETSTTLAASNVSIGAIEQVQSPVGFSLNPFGTR